MLYRPGTFKDAPDVLMLFDANVAWLVEHGRSDQWGAEPWSDDPTKVEFVKHLLADGIFTIAEMEGEVVGASLVTDHPMPYVPSIEEPERYLKLLIASPTYRGERIGARLIQLAREHSIREGIRLLRVDCYSGGDRRLVDYYISEGFKPTEAIEVRPGTSVQVFEWRSDR